MIKQGNIISTKLHIVYEHRYVYTIIDRNMNLDIRNG